ncbi:MAG: tetraacyldisaccharide 4'-kinase [Candidatus Marinimicrobia bacterium]|nr:tetraacyldisaccharide 4'-kinase [Candidatus Neomarinimicrobiota bacterium]|tara:strand:+ start:4612 stop:5670 length:1059 start_codon:yes stop_codon:yes gene_type:complete
MKILLYILSKIYCVLVVFWSKLYDKNILKPTAFTTPLLAIGNVVVGGSGKTPMTIYLSNLLSKKNIRHVIISRGYKKKRGGSFIVSDNSGLVCKDPFLCGEEPFLLAKKLSGIPVIVGENKIKSIRLGIERFNPQLVLIDDGFQTRKIKIDFHCVLIDSLVTKKDFSYLPFGLLREPLSGLKRANIIILTKKNLSKNQHNLLAPVFALAQAHNLSIISSEYKESFFVFNKKTGGLDPLDCSSTAKSPAFLICGIAREKSFKILAEKKYKNITDYYVFKDHHLYSEKELSLILSTQEKKSSFICITTYKDFIKIQNMATLICSYSVEFHIIDIEHVLNKGAEKILKEKIKVLF